MAGRDVARRSPRTMKRLGVAYVPEDRDRDGLVTTHAIASNASVASLAELSALGVLRVREESRFVEGVVSRLQIKAGDLRDAVSTLSERVWRGDPCQASLRSMRWIMESLMKASADWSRRSWSLASRRERPSQAKVRSTTQRRGWTAKPC